MERAGIDSFRLKEIAVGGQTVYAATEKDIARRPGIFQTYAAEQLQCISGFHLYPDAGAFLKFPDQRKINRFFKGSVNGQPVGLRGCIFRGRVGLTDPVVAESGDCSENRQQEKRANDPDFFAGHHVVTS